MFLDREAVRDLGRRIIQSNVMDEDEQTGFIRHNPHRLAQVLMKWYEQEH